MVQRMLQQGSITNFTTCEPSWITKIPFKSETRNHPPMGQENIQDPNRQANVLTFPFIYSKTKPLEPPKFPIGQLLVMNVHLQVHADFCGVILMQCSFFQMHKY